MCDITGSWEDRDRPRQRLVQRNPVAASTSLNLGSSTRSGTAVAGAGPGGESLFSKPFTLRGAERNGGDEGVDDSFNGASLMGGDEARECGTEAEDGSPCSPAEKCVEWRTSEKGRV